MLKKTKDSGILNQLKRLYRLKKKDILARLEEFQSVWAECDDEEIFTELAFCILTPQSKARTCWDAILKLKKNDLLFQGTVEQTKPYLNCARFKNKKAHYLVETRTLFMQNGNISIKPRISTFDSIYACRDWFVENIRGLGYKEASHFLRNIGLGENIAILDRHILRNLAMIGLIEDIPNSMSRKKYLEIERKMAEFAKQIHIPLSHLDLLFWYKETGEIFK
jgi:N-glycosylase/DNA lyase